MTWLTFYLCNRSIYLFPIFQKNIYAPTKTYVGSLCHGISIGHDECSSNLHRQPTMKAPKGFEHSAIRNGNSASREAEHNNALRWGLQEKRDNVHNLVEAVLHETCTDQKSEVSEHLAYDRKKLLNYRKIGTKILQYMRNIMRTESRLSTFYFNSNWRAGEFLVVSKF